MLKDIPVHMVTEILSVCLKDIVKSSSFLQLRYSNIDAIDLFLDIFCNGIAAQNVDKVIHRGSKCSN
jgi:hypothetical protein